MDHARRRAAARNHRLARAARWCGAASQLETMRQKRAETLAQIDRIHAAMTAAEKDEDDLRLALQRLKSAHDSGDRPALSESPIGPLTQLDAIARDPNLQAKYFATRRRVFMDAYGPLLRKLRLGGEDEKKFLDQLMSFDQTSNDLVFAARLQGVSPGDPALNKLKQEMWAQLREQQTELLGPAGADEVKEYNRTLGARAVVTRFAGLAAYAGTPLSLEQANQMAQSIADSSPKYQSGGDSDLTQVDWVRADQNLRAVLNPTQLTLFQNKEPVSEGPSRWLSALNRVINDAKAADRKTALPSASAPSG